MATFTVTLVSDELDDLNGTGEISLANFGGPGDLSLREAIALANDQAGVDTITFASGTGEAFENGGTIRLTQGELEATEALTIDGSTAGGRLILTGDADGDDTTVDGITDVLATLAGAQNDNTRIKNVTASTGTVTLEELTFTGGRSGDSGGAIRSKAILTLIDSTISGNYSQNNGGGVFGGGEVTLTNSTVSGNFAL